MKEANPPTAMTINIEYRNTISSSGTIIALPLPTINSKHMKDMYLLFQENHFNVRNSIRQFYDILTLLVLIRRRKIA